MDPRFRNRMFYCDVLLQTYGDSSAEQPCTEGLPTLALTLCKHACDLAHKHRKLSSLACWSTPLLLTILTVTMCFRTLLTRLSGSKHETSPTQHPDPNPDSSRDLLSSDTTQLCALCSAICFNEATYGGYAQHDETGPPLLVFQDQAAQNLEGLVHALKIEYVVEDEMPELPRLRDQA